MPKEYIEREAVIDLITRRYENPEICKAEINAIPAADVAPVVHGKWLNFYGDFSAEECNICGEIYEVSPDESPRKEFFDAFKMFYKYCPNCGAKMDTK